MNFDEWAQRRYLNNFLDVAIDKDRQGLHVTDVTHPCPRHIYYKLLMRKKDPEWERRTIDRYKANVFWLGSRYHEIPMSNVVVRDDGGIIVLNDLSQYEIKEEEVEWGDTALVVYDRNGMKVGTWGFEFPIYDKELELQGRIDELMYFDGHLYVLDKKTTWNIPAKPYENYINQVKIYAAILNKYFNIQPDRGAIFFIQKRNLMLRTYEFELESLDAIYVAFAEKVRSILEAVDILQLPNKIENGLCRFCEFKDLCMRNEADVPLHWGERVINQKKIVDYNNVGGSL